MKSKKPYSLLAISALITFASAINVVSLGIQRSTTLAAQLKRREIIKRDPISATINNVGALHGYAVNVTIGTPPQTLALGVDTGSSDVWLLSSTSDLCTSVALQQKTGQTCNEGTFSAKDSSTVTTVSTGDLNITYYSGQGVTGDYIKDDFTIGGVELQGLQMGLGLNTTINQGIMGLGYSRFSIALDTIRVLRFPSIGSHVAATTKYPNLIDTLVAQNKINSSAYSLYLNSLSDSTGILLFGGIDNKKYTGSLATIDIIPYTQNPDTYVQPFIPLQGIALAYSSSNSTAIPVTSAATDGSSLNVSASLLDSGAPFILLPSSITQKIFSALGAVGQSSNPGGIMYVDCSILTSYPDLTLNFEFGFPQNGAGPVIKVPITELVFNLTTAYGATGAAALAKTNLPFKNTCILGIEENAAVILGDTFLRSAYVVYDLTNNKISLGQTNFGSTDSDIVEISANSSSSTSSSSAGPSSSTTSPSKTASGTTVTETSTGSAGTSTTKSTTGATSKAAAAALMQPINTSSFVLLTITGIWSVVGGMWIWL